MVELDHAILPQGRVSALLVNLLFRHFFGLVGNETHTLWTGKDIGYVRWECFVNPLQRHRSLTLNAFVERSKHAGMATIVDLSKR